MNTVINKSDSFIDRVVNIPRVKYVLQHRAVLAILLLVLQGQFFTINMLNSALRSPTAGWELKIASIDNNLTPLGYWMIPYAMGNVLAGLVPLWAAFVMPNTEYRQFFFGMTFAIISGYVIYILFPTYVVKPTPDAVPGTDVFARILRDSYEVDAEISSHNAAPSQHVYYAVLIMCFMLNFRPRARVFWTWTAIASLISASALLTMRHNSPDIIAGYAMAVIAYYVGMRLGAHVTHALDDAFDPVRFPPWVPAWVSSWLRGTNQPTPRPAPDLDMGIS